MAKKKKAAAAKPERPLVRALVIALPRKRGQEFDGWGTVEFRELPRIGENLVRNNEAGTGEVFRVVAIDHAVQPIASTVGDVWVKYMGTVADHAERLTKGDY